METESNKRKFTKQNRKQKKLHVNKRAYFQSAGWLNSKKHIYKIYDIKIPYSYQSPSQSQHICVPQTCHIHQSCQGPTAEEFVLLLLAFPEREQATINTAIRCFWLCTGHSLIKHSLTWSGMCGTLSNCVSSKLEIVYIVIILLKNKHNASQTLRRRLTIGAALLGDKGNNLSVFLTRYNSITAIFTNTFKCCY